MNPSATVVQISIPFLTNCIVSLPLFGMVASFITSVLFTKEQIFESECGVSVDDEARRRRHVNVFCSVTEFHSVLLIRDRCVSR